MRYHNSIVTLIYLTRLAETILMAISPAEGKLISFHCKCDNCKSRGGISYFFYGPEPPVFSFKAIVAPQRQHHIITGLAPVREINACSSVPALREHQSYEVLSRELYEKNQDSWQRSLDPERSKSIGRFWRKDSLKQNLQAADNDTTIEVLEENSVITNNKLVNPIVLGLSKNGDPCTNGDPDNHPEYGDSPEMIDIEFNRQWYGHVCGSPQCGDVQVIEILNELPDDEEGVLAGKAYVRSMIEKFDQEFETGEWTLYADHCPKSSCVNHRDTNTLSQLQPKANRPLEIIDGQHRTRGINSEENSVYEHDENYGICLRGKTHKYDAHIATAVCGNEQWKFLTQPTRENVPFSILALNTPRTDDALTRREQAIKAKVFVDINTMAEELIPTHKMTMLWRHKFDKGKISQWDLKDLDFSSAGKTEAKIYQLILEMAREAPDREQLSGKIPPLVNKLTGDEIFSIKFLRERLTSWMQPNKIFSAYVNSSQAADFANIFHNYLRGWAWNFSGPKREVDIEGERVWTPSHPDFSEGHYEWDQIQNDYHVELEQLSQGGHYQTPTNDTPAEKAKQGEVNNTIFMQVILNLFNPISYHIMNGYYQEEREDGLDNDMPLNLLSTSYNPIILRGENSDTLPLNEIAFRDEIKRFKDRMNFQTDDFDKAKWKTKQIKNVTWMICDEMGWKKEMI